MEPNPYEPPHKHEPLTTGKIAKRGLGVGAIILLTPVAVAIAFGASCAASYAVLGIATSSGARSGMVITVALAVFVVPPVAVLMAMIRWGIKTHRQAGGIEDIESKPEESPNPKRKKSLWEQLVQFPSVSFLALLILTVAVISAILFTWLAYSMTAFQPPPP